MMDIAALKRRRVQARCGHDIDGSEHRETLWPGKADCPACLDLFRSGPGGGSAAVTKAALARPAPDRAVKA